MPLSLHEEDPALIANNGINRGPVSEKLGIGGSPAEAEVSMVERDCRLAEETGVSLSIQHISTKGAVEAVRRAKERGAKVTAEAAPHHFTLTDEAVLRYGTLLSIQHISTKGAVEAVRRAKERGAKVTAEAAPHHFTLTDEAVLRYGTLAKMNPPLRTEEDRLAVIEGLKDGTIDMIATDHAPHSREEKEKGLTEAPSGIVGLETALALGITSLVKPGHLTLMQLMEKMSRNPARLYGLPCQGIAAGAPADLVIFDEKEEWTVTGFSSKSSNSPFLGEKLTGRVHYTICQGKIASEL